MSKRRAARFGKVRILARLFRPLTLWRHDQLAALSLSLRAGRSLARSFAGSAMRHAASVSLARLCGELSSESQQEREVAELGRGRICHGLQSGITLKTIDLSARLQGEGDPAEALAAKMARIIWALLRHEQNYQANIAVA